MNKDFLANNPDVPDIARRVAQDQAQTFRRQEKVVKSIQAQTNRLFDHYVWARISEEDLKRILETITEVLSKVPADRKVAEGTSVREGRVETPPAPKNQQTREVG